MNQLTPMNNLLLLLSDLANAQVKVDNAVHSSDKLDQSDSWHDGYRLHYGRHAKSARTRLEKARRVRDRLARQVEDLKARQV